MKEFIDKLIERLEEISEPIRPVGWSKKIEVVETKAVIDSINQLAKEMGNGSISDGYHTFNELYHHRAVLFAAICNSHKEFAWKSKLHDTGDMYEGMFIVGIETPEGQATYHYDINPYWDMFKVKELPNAPKWDRHTPDEAIRRIGLIAEEYDQTLDVAELVEKFGQKKVRRNADRIRAMSDEELAEFLQRFGTFNQPCSLSVGEPLKWLQSEAE